MGSFVIQYEYIGIAIGLQIVKNTCLNQCSTYPLDHHSKSNNHQHVCIIVEPKIYIFVVDYQLDKFITLLVISGWPFCGLLAI